MSKKYYFLFFVAALSVSIMNPCVFAQNNRSIVPVLSDDSISVASSQIDEDNTTLAGSDTQSIPEEDELEDDFFEEYDDIEVP